MRIDDTLPDKIEKFCAKYLRHTKAPHTGKPFILLPWQKDFIRNVFGRVGEDGKRLIREAYLEVPRKNGKSFLIAAIALFFLICGDIGEEIYVAASTKEQSSILFKLIDDFVCNSRTLQKEVRVLRHSKTIECPKKRSVLKSLSREADSAHGLNPSIAICDEVHTFPDDAIYQALKTGQLARPNPLMIGITTAGTNKNGFAYQQHQYILDLESGKDSNPTFYGKIYGLREQDDWTDREVWKRCNPSMGSSVTMEAMEAEFIKAQRSATAAIAFRTYNLNSWEGSDKGWLSYAQFEECLDESLNFDDFIGCDTYLAVDLSSTRDLTAITATFYKDETFYNFSWGFIPEETIERRTTEDKVPYAQWVEEGKVTSIPGKTIKYDVIFNKIKSISEVCNVVSVAFDKWNAKALIDQLEAEGFTVFDFKQSGQLMSTAIKTLEVLILDKRIKFNNVVTVWCGSNAVPIIDHNENVKLSKAKAKERIDLIISSIMSTKLCADAVNESPSVVVSPFS